MSAGTIPWAIQGEEKAKFDRIFFSLGPVDGKLNGEKVKPVLLNSKLSVDVLGKVWELSDIDKDGLLDQDEFCVAMHIVYEALEKKPVPQTLPTNLIPLSKRKHGNTLAGAVPVLPTLGITPLLNSNTKKTDIQSTSVLDLGLDSLSLLSPKKSASPTSNLLQPTSIAPKTIPLTSTVNNTSIAPTANSKRIVIPDEEKIRFEAIFKQQAVDGYINGVAARDVFLQSGQPQPVLAHVWNMCDEQKLGKLTQEQFTLAMHFIMLKVRGLEIPVQLTSDMMPSPSSDSAFGESKDSGSFSDASSGIGDFSAVRELDALNREIEDLRKEKESLTKEIREKEMTIRHRSNEVQDLQDQVDHASTSLSQLESDKVESTERLDELEQQQLKLDGMLVELRTKVNNEQMTIAKLKEQIKEQELMATKQEQEYAKVQNELQMIKQEEIQLQQRLEAGTMQLNSVNKQIDETKNEITKAKTQIENLKEQQKVVSSNISQYDKAVTALKTESDENDKSFKLDAVAELGMNDFNSSDDIFNKSDPFKSDDPFAPTKSDPFASTDAFGTNATTTSQNISGFDSDPFASTTTTSTQQKDDFFSTSSDPFGNSSTDVKDDPFAGEDLFKDKSDPFADTKNDAFGSTDVTSGFTQDPFKGSDPFAGESTTTKKPAHEKERSVSFKTTFDDDDSMDFFGGFDNKNNSSATSTITKSSDPWGFGGSADTSEKSKDNSASFFSSGSDPFGGESFDFGSKSTSSHSSKSKKSDKKSLGHSTKKKSGMTADDAQLAWVAAQSKREEEERKEKLRLQEQADLELAIALSKEDK